MLGTEKVKTKLFILNNIRGRDHKKIYGRAEGQALAIFDISEKQINSAINSDWKEMKPGDLVCVIESSYKMSTIYKISSIEQVGEDKEEGKIFLVRGEIVAKLPDESEYTQTLNKNNVKHERLKNNTFCIGFNIANLKTQMDSAEVKTKLNARTIGELKKIVCA
jgi:hypothetical protein